MGKFEAGDVKGVVHTDSGHVAVLKDGQRVSIDKSENKSLMNRLDKDRSRMERDGSREKEREPERRKTAEQVFREQQERLRRRLPR